MNQFPKIKTIGKDSFYFMDPTGIAPVSPLVKSRILLHKLQARVHKKDIKTKEALLQGPPLFDKRIARSLCELCLLTPLYQTYKLCQ